jgi:hypothetical protein
MTAASGARDECLFELIFELHQVASAWPVDPRSDARRSAKSRIQAQDFLATKEADSTWPMSWLPPGAPSAYLFAATELCPFAQRLKGLHRPVPRDRRLSPAAAFCLR